MYNLEERVSLWEEIKDKYNFRFIKREDLKYIKEKTKDNFLILPSIFEIEYLDIIKRYFLGEIFSETLNLFYFIKKDIESFNDEIYKYELNPISQTVKIKIVNTKTKLTYYIEEKTFTPVGVVEFLQFNGFKVKDIAGDKLRNKIKENSRYLVVRFERV